MMQSCVRSHDKASFHIVKVVEVDSEEEVGQVRLVSTANKLAYHCKRNKNNPLSDFLTRAILQLFHEPALNMRMSKATEGLKAGFYWALTKE